MNYKTKIKGRTRPVDSRKPRMTSTVASLTVCPNHFVIQSRMPRRAALYQSTPPDSLMPRSQAVSTHIRRIDDQAHRRKICSLGVNAAIRAQACTRSHLPKHAPVTNEILRPCMHDKINAMESRCLSSSCEVNSAALGIRHTLAADDCLLHPSRNGSTVSV